MLHAIGDIVLSFNCVCYTILKVETLTLDAHELIILQTRPMLSLAGTRREAGLWKRKKLTLNTK